MSYEYDDFRLFSQHGYLDHADARESFVFEALEHFESKSEYELAQLGDVDVSFVNDV